MLSHLMPDLTDADLDREIQRLRQSLPELDRQIQELTRSRDVRTTKRVMRLLPRLSRRVLLHLQEHHPAFLTPERLALFKSQLPAFGLLHRKGHAQALVLLQAQFKAYLLEASQENAEQWLLRSLGIRRNETLRDLEAAEAQRRHRSVGMLAGQADTGKWAGRSDADDSALNWAMTQTMMQADMASTQGITSPGEKAECIATDDSLGCFS